MIENFDKIKNYVLTLSELEPSAKLDIQIETIIQECLAYCYRSNVPEAMELPLANVIVSELQKRNIIGVDGDISSYSEGDMSVSFNGNGSISTSKQFYNGKLEAFKQVIGATKDV